MGLPEPKSFGAGGSAAFLLGSALAELGLPWDRIPGVGNQFAGSMEAESAKDHSFLAGFRKYFNDLNSAKSWAPLDTPHPDAGPSEYMVVDRLVTYVGNALLEKMPHSAPAVFEVLSAYDRYLEEIQAETFLLERARRIRHAVSDIEAQASGRG